MVRLDGNRRQKRQRQDVIAALPEKFLESEVRSNQGNESYLLKGRLTVSATKGTRERLLDVAQDLIQKRGINAFSFQDLSEAVGIRKASVHHHFATKSDLIESLMKRFLRQFEEMIRKVVTSKANGRTKLKRYCNLFHETLNEGNNDKGCFCGMLMAEVMSVEKGVQGQIQQFIRKNVDVVEAILSEGVEDGTLALPSGSKSAALVVLSTLEGALLIARCDQGPTQFSTVVKDLITLLSAK